MAQNVEAVVAPARRGSAQGAPQGQRSRLGSAGLWVAVTVAVTLLCWHALPLQPTPSRGSSWQGALHMAHHYGLIFGNQLTFTYGPLGFLIDPTLWYTGTGIIASLYQGLLRLALAAALFAGARRTYGTWGGALVALVAVGLSVVTLEAVPYLVLGVWMVDQLPGDRRRLWLMALGGAFAGVQLLNKESTGIELTVMALIVALACRGRRSENVLATVAALVLALLFFWAVTGQSFGALGDYLRNSYQIISGYAAALEAEKSQRWQLLTGVVAAAFGLYAAVQMTADGPAQRRWGIVLLWLAFCFFEYKEGFVRHDKEHATMYFVALMGGFLALRWSPRRWGVGLGLAAILALFAVGAQRSEVTKVVDPVANVASAFRQLAQVLVPSKRHAIMENGRREIQATFPLEPAELALLRGHTVHAQPDQDAVVWAYDLQWRPLPVIQNLMAYTPTLDRRDSEALESPRAPQRILRIGNQEPSSSPSSTGEIDGRVEAFTQGQTTRTILCRYRQLYTSAVAQVLALAGERCGATVALSTVHANWGQKVAIPPLPNDHSYLFVRITGVQVSGLEHMAALLYKPRVRHLLLDGVPHRLVEETAADGLILRAPANVDFAKPYNFAPDANTIAVSEGGPGVGSGMPITYAFFAQEVNASASGGPLAAPATHRASPPPTVRTARSRR